MKLPSIPKDADAAKAMLSSGLNTAKEMASSAADTAGELAARAKTEATAAAKELAVEQIEVQFDKQAREVAHF